MQIVFGSSAHLHVLGTWHGFQLLGVASVTGLILCLSRDWRQASVLFAEREM